MTAVPTKEGTSLINQEIQKIFRKGAITITENMESSLLLVGKKDRGDRPVINVKEMNKSIPYAHFKTRELFLSKEFFMAGDLMQKIDLKDAYFAVPLTKCFQKYVGFQWKDSPF